MTGLIPAWPLACYAYFTRKFIPPPILSPDWFLVLVLRLALFLPSGPLPSCVCTPDRVASDGRARTRDLWSPLARAPTTLTGTRWTPRTACPDGRACCAIGGLYRSVA